MEGEEQERPSKLIKLSHGAEVDEQVVPHSNDDNTSNATNHLQNGDNDASAEDQAARTLGESSENQPKNGSSLSKNQLKKLRKREEWEAGREYRKAKRKQKLVEKKERKRAEARAASNSNINNTLASNGDDHDSNSQGKTSKRPRIRHTTLPITIIIDCGFDNLMLEKEMISLGSQLTRSYSDNHRARFQAHLAISSWGGTLKHRFDTVLNQHYRNWKRVRFEEEDFSVVAEKARQWMIGGGGGDNHAGNGGKLDGVFLKYRRQPTTVEEKKTPVERFDKEIDDGKDAATATAGNNEEEHEPPTNQPQTQTQDTDEDDLKSQGEIVYLTSDSPYTLEELKPYSTYIVGGLVDKNRHKGICYKTACEKGIKTAKLPIGEHMRMQSRFVLATNHVVEIMIRWLECGDWGEAFVKVIPKRKGGTLKVDGGGGAENGQDGQDGQDGENVQDADDDDGDGDGDEADDDDDHDENNGGGSTC